MKNATINRGIIKKIALALGEFNDAVIFVGGATVGLYINDVAAEDVRPTIDVDISLSLASLAELEKMRMVLSQKGFIQSVDDTIVCRFRYEDIRVDVMNTKAIGWAPANPWFEAGFQFKEKVNIDGQIIQILPIPYFLATKFAAFNDRGKTDPRTSHDFEDIIYILDNRTDLDSIIQNASDDVRSYLRTEFKSIIMDKLKQEAIL